jgi:hypothetical protein
VCLLFPAAAQESERRGMGNPQGSRSSPRVSDEELEYYGDLYVRCDIRGKGVDFESFLNNPEYYLQKHARGHPALGGRDGDEERKDLRSRLRLHRAPRTSPE